MFMCGCSNFCLNIYACKCINITSFKQQKAKICFLQGGPFNYSQAIKGWCNSKLPDAETGCEILMKKLI